MSPDLKIKLRNLIKDNLVSRSYDYVFYTSRIFRLVDANVVEGSLSIEKNGVEWNDTGNYDYDATRNKITISSETGIIDSGATLRISYNCYEKYSDEELETYLKNAMYYLSVYGYTTFDLETGDTISPTPTTAEENLIVMVAGILMKGSIRSYRTPEFTINFANDDSPEEKIKKLLFNFDKTFASFVYIDLTADPIETGD